MLRLGLGDKGGLVPDGPGNGTAGVIAFKGRGGGGEFICPIW